MIRKRILPFAGLIIALMLICGARNGQAQGAAAYKIGSHVADFAFKSDLGKTVKLSDYRGKTIVLVMFATW